MSDELKELLETGQIALMQVRALQQAGHEAVIREAEEAWEALREKTQEAIPEVLWPYLDLQRPEDDPIPHPNRGMIAYLRVPGCAPVRITRQSHYSDEVKYFSPMIPQRIEEWEEEFYVHTTEGTRYDDVATALAEAEEYGAAYDRLKAEAEERTQLAEKSETKPPEKPPVPQWKQHLEHAKAYANDGSTGLAWAVIALVERFEQFVNFEAGY